MPEHFGYSNAIIGTQSTVNGAAQNYAFAPPTGGDWRYSGPDTNFVVDETTGASNFNGDETNEQVGAQEQIGGVGGQTTNIGGTDRQIICDYSFTVTNGTTTWRVTVIDVDLNNDDDLNDAGEDGYFLIFPDGMPPVDTDLTIGGIVDNADFVSHASLGAAVVCFAQGTLISTASGTVPVQNLSLDDLVETRDGALQAITCLYQTTVTARGDLAPIVITCGTLGNTRDLVVSPQHSILLNDWRAELLFGHEEVLVRAVDLLGHDGVYRKPNGVVTYYHILLEEHHLVRSEGIWSESLYPGNMALQTEGSAARDEIPALFRDLSGYGPKAAPCLRSFEAACLRAA